MVTHLESEPFMFATRINQFLTRTPRILALMLALLATVTIVGCTGGSDKGSGDGGSASSKSPTSLSGTYEFKHPEGTMTCEFLDASRFKMSMLDTGGGSPDTSEGTYTINANMATLQVPGGIPMQFTIKGNMLEGTVMGQNMIFTKK